MKVTTNLLAFLVCVGIALPVTAETAFFNTTITRVLVTGDDEFGGVVRPQAALSDSLQCNNTWATMDCAGVLGSRAAGNKKFDTAQLAVLLKKKIGLTVTDDKKINGWCYVERVAFSN